MRDRDVAFWTRELSSRFAASGTARASAETAILPSEPGGVVNSSDLGGELIAEVEERARPPFRLALSAPESRHERPLARVVSGPHDFASAVLRVYEYHRLRRQSLGRGSPRGGEVAPKDVGRVSAGFSGKRATEKIYAPA